MSLSLEEPFLSLWANDSIHQDTDPKYSNILGHISEGKHSKEDISEILQLENTDISYWPENRSIKVYMTNNLANTVKFKNTDHWLVAGDHSVWSLVKLNCSESHELLVVSRSGSSFLILIQLPYMETIKK